MNDTKPACSKSTRRRFLVASLAFSTAAVTGTTWLRGAAAWAEADNDATLAQFGRLLFPINGLGDDVYKNVMGNVLSALSGNPATAGALATAEAALDSQQDSSWFDLDEAAQIEAIENIQGEAFFAAIVGTLRGAFYYDPAVWAHIDYPGSSKEHGGYLHRGFDDIGWLPESS
jgi:hypothetical protein